MSAALLLNSNDATAHPFSLPLTQPQQASKYPERVQHLLLVSPAGVGRRPSEWEPSRLPSAWSLRGALARFLIWSWDSDLTPGRVIRGLGPLGPGLVQRYARGRFQQGLALSDAEVARFESYFYHILVARGSGEFALRHILAPFAWPRQALEERCADLQVPVTIFYGMVLRLEVEEEREQYLPIGGKTRQDSVQIYTVLTSNSGV